MSAFLKVYTDSGHTAEVAHTAQNSTTTAGGTQGIGTSTLQVSSTSGMPAQGVVDIDTAGNLETLAYTNVVDTTHLALAHATTISHASGVAVVQWYYTLAVGDQTNGIVNDGTQAIPTGLNTVTWYLYNAGDQTAQSITLATASGAPSTANGFTDTVISITSANSGFATSVTPANMTAGGAVQQFWVCEEVPLGQGNTPSAQVCVLNLAYQSV